MKNIILLGLFALVSTATQAEVLNCGGTEPFWDLTINEAAKTINYKEFSGDEDDAVEYKKLKVRTTSNDLSVRNFKAKRGLGGRKAISAFVSVTDGTYRGFCSDGMSDFNYQYEIFVDVQGTILQGCCESSKRPRLGEE